MKASTSFLKPLTIAAVTAVAFTAILSGCGRNQSLATVNGDPITTQEFYDYLDTKPTVKVVVSEDQKVELPVADTLGFQAMQDLITHKLLLQMAKDEKVEPTQKEVDDEIDFRGKLKPGFISNLKERGLSMESIRRLVKTELCQYRLQTQGVTVSDADVTQYISEHKDEMVQPEAVEAYWILAKSDESKAKIQKFLDSGMDFKSVAKQYSEDPKLATYQGQYPFNIVKKMPVGAREPISKLKAGETSDWVKGDVGYAKFMVARRSDEKPIEMTPERKEYIKRQLMIERGSKANDLGKRLAAKLRESKTDVGDPALKDLWSKYQDKLKDASVEAKTSTTTMDAK